MRNPGMVGCYRPYQTTRIHTLQGILTLRFHGNPPFFYK